MIVGRLEIDRDIKYHYRRRQEKIRDGETPLSRGTKIYWTLTKF